MWRQRPKLGTLLFLIQSEITISKGFAWLHPHICSFFLKFYHSGSLIPLCRPYKGLVIWLGHVLWLKAAIFLAGCQPWLQDGEPLHEMSRVPNTHCLTAYLESSLTMPGSSSTKNCFQKLAVEITKKRGVWSWIELQKTFASILWTSKFVCFPLCHEPDTLSGVCFFHSVAWLVFLSDADW